MGSQLASLYQETDMELKFRELSTDALWGIRLGKLGVSILRSATKFHSFWHPPVRKFTTKVSLPFAVEERVGGSVGVCDS